MHWKSLKGSPLLVVLALFVSSSGCYYGHLAVGQARLLAGRQSIGDVIANPETAESLRESLTRVEATRAFAQDLGLEVEGQYTSYVDWPGDRIVTTVVATRPGEIDAHLFDFPIVGRVPYKGFFDPEAAREEAARLAREGMDTCLVPVTAYSTLGWLDDPVTAPMLRRSDDELVETLLHELVHANVFIADQPDFNEGVARFFGEEAAVVYFARGCTPDAPCPAESVRARIDDDRLIAGVLLAFRDRVAALYAGDTGPEDRARLRGELEAQARTEVADLPLRVRPAARVAERLRLGDACQALRGTYSKDLAAHARVLAGMDGELRAFIAHLKEASVAPDPRAAFFGPSFGPS